MNESVKEFVHLLATRCANKPELRDFRVRAVLVWVCANHPEKITHRAMQKLLMTTDKTTRRLRDILLDHGYVTESFKDREIVIEATQKALDLVSPS